MGKRTDAREKFKRADELFREKNFAEALVVLDELDNEFPETKNVIYPRAMCLARVGRFDEALDLCRQLKVEFGDARGEKLMVKIGALRKAHAEQEKAKEAPAAGGAAVPPANVYTLESNPPPLDDRLKGKNVEFSPVFDPLAAGRGAADGVGPLGAVPDAFDLGDGSPAIDMAGLDDLFARKPAAAAPAPPKAGPRSRKGLYIGAGVAAAVLALIVVLPLVLRGGDTQSATPSSAQAPQGAQELVAEPAAPQFDGPEIDWPSSIDDVYELTDEDGRGALLVFYSGSSPSTDMDLMDSSVWNDPTIRYIAQGLVCAKVDVDTDPSARDRWQITKLPTTIVMDYAFEEPYFRQEGFVDAQQFYTAMMDNGLVPQGDTQGIELPHLPVIALVLLPFVYVVATFLPVLFTLLMFGHMPEDDPVTGLLGMLLVGLVAPFLGRWVMRATYQLGPIEIIVYYVLLLVHLVAGNWVMTVASGLDMPFFVYLYAVFFSHQYG